MSTDEDRLLSTAAAELAMLADPHAYRQYIAGGLSGPPESPFVDLSHAAAAGPHDTSRPEEALQTRQLPAVPPWVQNPEKWVTLSRAERRALERHHRKLSGR